MSCTQRPGSGRPQQTSRRENHHIVENAHVHTSSAAIQAQAAPSLGTPVSSRAIRRRLAEGHLGSRHPLRVLPLTPTHQRFHLSGVPHEETGWQQNGNRSSLATNPDSISAGPRSHFSTRQCSASHGKGVTRLSPHFYYSSLACPIP
ncbi:HTH_Tnp_Tc3_2 domain-containing protein [Trichonephila clavipes]|nr:HTH_Tnp_Tc3_2 domain-containing protein [Trichonephila clavipes]